MREIKTEIVIQAPAAQLWEVLMEHTSYGNWNPFIKHITGSTVVGKKLAVTIQPPNQKAMKFEPIVVMNEPLKEFRWKGKLFMKGIFDGEHYFRLVPINETETKFVHGERFTGILSGILLKMIGKNTQVGFKEMNSALKNRAEQRNQ